MKKNICIIGGGHGGGFLSILLSAKISTMIERSINKDLLLSIFLFERYIHFGETINILKFYTDTALIYIVYNPYLC